MQVQTANAAAVNPASIPALLGQHKEREVVGLSRVNLRTFLDAREDKIVSVDFVKKDGVARTLTGRLGVKSYLKGGLNTVESYDRPYLTVFDLQICQYRTVNLSTVREVRSNGKTYRIID